MLKMRVVTAVVLLAVFLPVTLFASVNAFGALIALIIMLAAWEWARLLKVGRVWTALVLFASSGLGEGVPLSRPFFQAAAVFWVLVGPFVLARKPLLASGAWRFFLLIVGIVVLVACWQALVAARALGVSFVLSLLIVVWVADIGAYFAGKTFGTHKLAPAISPGKTWEGAVGGWLAVLIVAGVALIGQWYEPTLFTKLEVHFGTLRTFIVLSLLVALSVIGDLFESLLKRQAGVKDSSGLLPGHGGVLDRIDALLPVLPVAMLLIG